MFVRLFFIFFSISSFSSIDFARRVQYPDTTNRRVGLDLQIAGDINGDRILDYFSKELSFGPLNQFGYPSSGVDRVKIFSGADGQLLKAFDNPLHPGNIRFGSGFAALQDFNGDNIKEILILMTNHQARLFDGSTGTEISRGLITNPLIHMFGIIDPEQAQFSEESKVYAIGDVIDANNGHQNGQDGFVDFVITAPHSGYAAWHGYPDPGYVYFYSGKDLSDAIQSGGLIKPVPRFIDEGVTPPVVGIGTAPQSSNDGFGFSFIAVRDVDGDGLQDYIAGTKMNHANGYIKIISGDFSQATCNGCFYGPAPLFQPMKTFAASQVSMIDESITGLDVKGFGAVLADLGDSDQDGVPELAVSAPGGYIHASNPLPGEVFVFDPGNQSIIERLDKSALDTTVTSHLFGAGVASIPFLHSHSHFANQPILSLGEVLPGGFIDMNLDGRRDLIVSIPGLKHKELAPGIPASFYSSSNQGGIALFYGTEFGSQYRIGQLIHQGTGLTETLVNPITSQTYEESFFRHNELLKSFKSEEGDQFGYQILLLGKTSVNQSFDLLVSSPTDSERVNEFTGLGVQKSSLIPLRFFPDIVATPKVWNLNNLPQQSILKIHAGSNFADKHYLLLASSEEIQDGTDVATLFNSSSLQASQGLHFPLPIIPLKVDLGLDSGVYPLGHTLQGQLKPGLLNWTKDHFNTETLQQSLGRLDANGEASIIISSGPFTTQNSHFFNGGKIYLAFVIYDHEKGYIVAKSMNAKIDLQ